MNGIASQMIFSPQNCTLKRLEDTLTPNRRKLAEQILARAEATVSSGGSCNTLVVGPRGNGKTHLLHYVRKVLEERHAGSQDLKIVVLPEDERGVASLLDFLIAILNAAGVPRETLLTRLSGMSGPAGVEEACSIFRDATGGKPTFLIVENLSDLFDRLGDEVLPQLRGFLQDHAFVSIIGSSVSLFTESQRHDHPFYGYFTLHPLKPLDAVEAREYLALLADANGDAPLASELRRASSQKRVNAIFDLTGGNHRLLAMLATFLTVEGLDELVQPFMQMVDRELTPYYQQRLDRLSPQQYRIVLAVAEQNGRAISVKEIAQHAFLGDTVVSRLLCDLRDGGFLARKQLGRESYHELQEPLLRLVLELKQGRDRPLPLIVSLLNRWYEVDELRELEAGAKGVAKTYLQAALRVAGRLPEPEMVRAESRMLGGTKRGPLERSSDFSEQTAAALANKGTTLGRRGQFEEALGVCEEVVRRFGTSDRPTLQEPVADALVGKIAALAELGRREEAITVCEEVARRFGESEQPGLLKDVALSLVNKGVILGQLGRTEEEVAAYDAVVLRFGTSGRPELQEPAAMAMEYKGVTLDRLGRVEEAIAAREQLVRLFGASDQPSQQERVAAALVSQGVALGQLDRTEESVAAFDEVVRRFGASDGAQLLERVGIALVNKGMALGQLRRVGEEIAAYEEVVRRFGASDQSVLQEAVARALVNKGIVLEEMGRHEEALTAFDEVVRRSRTSERPALLEQVARALVNKGVALGRLRRLEEEIAAYEEVVRRFGTSDQSVLQEGVARALVHSGVALGQLGRTEEAMATLERAVRGYGDSDRPELLGRVADALTARAALLGLGGRYQEALAACEEALRKQPQHSRSMGLRATVLLALGRRDEGMEAVQQALRLTTITTEQRAALVAFVLEQLGNDVALLRRLRTACSGDPASFALGLIAWLRKQMPVAEADVVKIEESAMALREAFGDMAEAGMVLKMLDAAIRNAKGDKRALLELPLELRRLLQPEDEKTETGS